MGFRDDEELPGLFEKIESLKVENTKLRAEVERLTKNDYTEYSCSVCLTRIRGREARCEEGGAWYHPLCKVAQSRDAALLQNGEAKRLLGEALRWIGVDPSYQESIQMDGVTAEIMEFLRPTEH